MRRIEILSAIGFLLAAACSMESGLVGGQCATGYEPCGHTCCVSPKSATGEEGGVTTNGDAGTNDPDAMSNGDTGNNNNGDSGNNNNDGGGNTDSGNTNDGGMSDGGGEGGPTCMQPDILCGNICLDPTNDPNNCGSCGKVCPSNSCVNGMCQGSAPGHLVDIGHDYVVSPQPGSSQARVIVNAMLLPLSNPVHIMSYERYSDSTAVSNVKALVNAAAQKLGRQVAWTPITQDAQVPQQLDITAFDVLFVPDQINASSGDLATLGDAWKQTQKLDAFAQAGGVLVTLDGGTGAGEMPALLTATGLLNVTAHQLLQNPSFTVTAPNDAVGSGVVSPYIPTAHTTTMTTEPNGNNVTYVVVKQQAPAVVHKVFP